MMERSVITISETGTVTMPDAPVWMTLPEVADMLDVFEGDVRRAVKTIYRNKELSEFDTMKYVRQPNGISYDVYGLEMVLAVSFRIQSRRSRIFRQYLTKRLYSGRNVDTRSQMYFIVHREVSNRKRRNKGNIYN